MLSPHINNVSAIAVEATATGTNTGFVKYAVEFVGWDQYVDERKATSTNAENKYLVLDGQQRLTSLFAAFKGTYGHKRLYIDALSGSSEGKDPGNEYYDCQFLSDKEATELTKTSDGARKHFIPIQELIKINPVHAATSANKKALELKLNEKDAEQITDIYIRCATILGNNKSLQVITVDDDPSHRTPIEEILEIFVRVNSGGLVLQKSDLLMSLLDLKWNDIQIGRAHV